MTGLLSRELCSMSFGQMCSGIRPRNFQRKTVSGFSFRDSAIELMEGQMPNMS